MNNIFRKNKVRRALQSWGFPVLLVCVAGLISCEKKADSASDRELGETEKVSALRKEVIAVHDEVMPLMTDIYQLKKKLQEKVDAGDISGSTRQQVDSILVQLDSADRGMREWMRSFSKLQTEGIPENEALDKLNSELKKISKVKDDMISSVAAAKAVD